MFEHLPLGNFWLLLHIKIPNFTIFTPWCTILITPRLHYVWYSRSPVTLFKLDLSPLVCAEYTILILFVFCLSNRYTCRYVCILYLHWNIYSEPCKTIHFGKLMV